MPSSMTYMATVAFDHTIPELEISAGHLTKSDVKTGMSDAKSLYT